MQVNDNIIEIPHIIHYCWFGSKPIPQKYREYIKSWKKYCPEFKIIEWNESNFPINEFSYAVEAYKEGKLAFVSDVARIYALEKYGGIYLDTDVEIIKPLYSVLEGKCAVMGWETLSENTIGTGFLAFIPKHKICKEMLEYYKNSHFKQENGKINMTSNTKILGELVKKEYGIEPSSSIIMKDKTIIYPRDYFTAFDTVTKQYAITDNTYCVHHFAASWFSPWKKAKREIKILINRMLRPLNYRI